MKFLIVAVVASGILFGSGSQVAAQVVQLPTFRLFSTNSSVLVPDRGAAYLGGVDRAAYGSNRRGLSRSIGSSVGSSGVSVHATIIDHDEIDRALLAEAARKRGDAYDVLGRPIDGGIRLSDSMPNPTATTSQPFSAADAIQRKAAFLSRHVVRNQSSR